MSCDRESSARDETAREIATRDVGYARGSIVARGMTGRRVDDDAVASTAALTLLASVDEARALIVNLRGRARVNPLRGASSATRRAHARAETLVKRCAAMGDVETARTLGGYLVERFGEDSARARAAGATAERAAGETETAEKMIEEGLERSPYDQRLMRSRVACALDRGDEREAIERLCEYLETHGADEEAWSALGKLYAGRGEYDKALFCYEEVVCAMPFDANAHRKMAEVLYTAGGRENVRDAKNHFALAIDFTSGKDVRAMYGAILCAKRLRETETDDTDGVVPRGEGAALADAAAERLLQRYAMENESMLRVVRPQIKRLVAPSEG